VDTGPDIRWPIEGNAHTHRGHFHVSARDGGLSRTVNAADVVDASPEARLWLDGFLRGQEATLFEFMGSSEDLLDRVDDDDLARWQTWNARFRTNGSAPGLNHLPPPVEALGRIDNPAPWCHVAGRYWIWREPEDRRISCAIPTLLATTGTSTPTSPWRFPKPTHRPVMQQTIRRASDAS
jgi:hypothetical protein